MTTIERSRFVADMSTRQIPVRDMTASLTGSGMGSVEIDALSGGDHIFNTPQEYGRLYDRLVALDNADRERGVTGDLDRARAVHRLYTASPSGPATPPPDPSARPRSTGVGAPSVLRPPAMEPVTGAQYVRAYGRMHAAQLRAGAEKNSLGPEAEGRRRILGETDRVATRVAGLEQQAAALPAGSTQRANIERQIDSELRLFEGTVTAERAIVDQQLRERASLGSTPGGEMLKRLPPYIRESAERKGIIIPGMPGAFTPSFSPKGGSWGIKF